MTRPTVLYVNQTAAMSGAERSLLDLLDAVSSDVRPVVACPSGPLRDEVEARGIPTRELPGTEVSFRPHPVHTARGVMWVGRAARRVRGLAAGVDARLVHANTTRAGLAASLAARAGAPPTVVHVRDWVPRGAGPSAVMRAAGAGAAAIVANSRYIAAQIPRGAPRRRVRVIHNPVDTRRFDPDRIDRDAARAAVGVGTDDLVLAVVAQLTPWKGQDDAIRIVARLAPRHERVRLLIAGSAKFTAPGTRFDNRAYERELRRLVAELGVGGRVRFLGERDDVPAILGATDVLLVPSWREAFGRIALEGMAMRVPVVATSVGGPSEIVRDRVEGRVLAPRDVPAWSEAIAEMLAAPGERLDIGERGRRRAAAGFGAERHAEQVTSVYREVLNGDGS